MTRNFDFLFCSLLSVVAATSTLSGCNLALYGWSFLVEDCVGDFDCRDVVIDGQPSDRCSPSGECVACLDTEDCPGKLVCCQGTCLSLDFADTKCGCTPAFEFGDEPYEKNCGSEDENPICLADGKRVTRETFANGECGCPCRNDEGGSKCKRDEISDRGFYCACDLNDAESCSELLFDGDGRPHRFADECSTETRCQCTAEGELCLDLESPDCTLEGCVDLATDPDHCGVANHECGSAETGIVGDDRCIGGGCVCDQDSDCASDNVNRCDRPEGEPARCVCIAYVLDGARAACPADSVCQTDGCLLDGELFQTQADMGAVLAP